LQVSVWERRQSEGCRVEGGPGICKKKFREKLQKNIKKLQKKYKNLQKKYKNIF
jgi:hypothetical protein